MSAQTKIQWTERTWNPVRGCSLVSPGCTNCYAMRQAHRFNGKGQPYEGLTRMTSKGPVWSGKMRLVESELYTPLHWRKPSRVFVNSMSDLFHESVPDKFITEIWNVMASATPDCGKSHQHEEECWQGPQHTFQILTKRPERMADVLRRLPYLADEHLDPEDPLPVNLCVGHWPLPNVWLGVSVENQEAADERIPLLLRTPAAVRFLSVEPLLGAVTFRPSWLAGYDYSGGYKVSAPRIDWVIIGGESGPRSRPCHLDWMRSIARQCKAAGVPTFVKQWGSVPVIDEQEWRDTKPTRLLSATKRDRYPGAVTLHLKDSKGGDPAEWSEDLCVREYPA